MSSLASDLVQPYLKLRGIDLVDIVEVPAGVEVLAVEPPRVRVSVRTTPDAEKE